MNSLRLFLSLAVLVALSAGMAHAQAVGDYGSAGTGNWGSTGANWVVCQTPGTWADATPASANPTTTTNVWIRTGHTVTLDNSYNCQNLTVETGASLVGNLNLPNSTISYLRVSGTTATINGVFGSLTAPGTNAALEAATSASTLTIGGTGTFGPARVRVNTGASGVTIIFNMNTTFYYQGSGGTGGVALYPQTDNNIFTVNGGKTLTFLQNASMSAGGATGSASNTNLTVNVYGTIDLSQDSSALNLKVSAGKLATFTIFSGGSVTVGGNLLASTIADAGSTAIAVDGSLTVGGVVDFSNPSLVVTGAGTLTVPAATNLIIGHAAGISSTGATGQIQTASRNFSGAAGYTYAGNAAQVTGGGLPSTVRSLTINNGSGVTLTNAATVSDTLRFTIGNLITNGHALVMGSPGIVSRVSGHVEGTLTKNVGTGSGVSLTFEVGTGANYAPVDIVMASVSASGTLSARTIAGDHPNLPSSNIDGTKSVNRYWTLVNNGITFTTFDATFSFVPGDVDAGAHPGVFIAEKYSGGAWSLLTMGTRTSTSTQVTGVNSFSDYAIGEEMGGPATPAFELSSNSLSINNIVIGHSGIDSVFVRNIGTDVLNVSSIVSSNTPTFTVAPSSATVAVGESARVTVTFTPSSPGSASANVVFTHNASGSPSTLHVTGNGLSSGWIQSNGTGGGVWALPGTWLGGVVPTSADSVVIVGSDSVFVMADTSCEGFFVQSGGKLHLFDTISVRHATVSGSVITDTTGRLTISDSASFGNGSIYQHARDGGNMPTHVRWDAGSTCLITGIVGNSPANGNQNYYNITWNCPRQSPNLNLGWSGNTIGGNITCLNSGAGRFQMTNNVAYAAPITIMGDVIVSGGGFTSTGSSGAVSYTVNSRGNIIVTGGNLGLSRSGSGLVTWNLYGNFSVSNATLQVSNANCRYVFVGSSPQTVTLTNVNYTGANNIEVSSGATVNMGTSVLRGTGAFIMDSAATLVSANANGIDSTLSNTGAKTLGEKSNFIFNGTSAQITGRTLADTLANLTISNAAGVTLSDSILVNGAVAVASGHLYLNGKEITLGPSGLLSETAGNTVAGTSGVITTTRDLNAPSSSTDIAGLGVSIGSSANLGSTVITRGHAVQPGAGSGSILRYFDIAPTTNTGLNATLVFHYDDSELNGIPENSLVLYRSTDLGTSWASAGGTVNTTANTLTLSGVNDLSRWTASAPSTVNVNTSLSSGWNMISNPVTNPVPDDSAKHLFPTILGRAFRFQNGYIASDTMHNGVGYWGKFPAATTNTITGSPRTRDSLSVNSGWNMVGSISNPVDTGTIVSVPLGIRASNWFGWSGAGYVVVTQLAPGKAFWIKANAAGKFVLANPPLRPVAKQQASGPEALDALNTLTVTDSRGGLQILYFGADAKQRIDLSLFDMPPAPPAGALDARFETASGGSLVQTHKEQVSEAVEFPVRVQSEAYPVTVTWKMNGGRASYELSDGQGGRLFRAKEMTQQGSVNISGSDLSRIVVRLVDDGSLPTEYALSQNYPNPFNPSTNVKYALPFDSRVSLEVYNVLGQRVRTLVSADMPAGRHIVQWEGTGEGGQQLASGVYFLQMSAKGTNGKTFSEVKKLMMLK